MKYEQLTPLPFMPIPGEFNLNTFLPGSSDYEIMARLVQTYNKAVELFNEIISQYSDIDTTISELTKEYQKQLNAYQKETDDHISSFEQDINTTVNAQDNKIAELASTVTQLENDIDDLLNGKYINNYVKELATWIDNNLQQLVAKVVKYVWFELDDSGYFIAYIPDTWDFVDFDTELDPDNEDYGKLALNWEDAVPNDAVFRAMPIIEEHTAYVTDETRANKQWTGAYQLSYSFAIQNTTKTLGAGKTVTVKTFTIYTYCGTSGAKELKVEAYGPTDSTSPSTTVIVPFNNNVANATIDVNTALEPGEILSVILTPSSGHIRQPTSSDWSDDRISAQNYQGTITYTVK